MDVYEYFLRKIGFKICHVSELQNLNSFESVDPADYSWDFFESGNQIGVCFGFCQKADVCKYVYWRLTFGSNTFIEQYSRFPSFSSQFIMNCKNLIKQMTDFPEELTSKEEVDLLLTLHGMNKGV